MSETVAIIAARLCPTRVLSVMPVGGGGNSRLYRVTAEGGALYALKCYPPRGNDPRDRLGQETAALAFVARHDPSGRVPVPVAADAETGCALFSWIDGAPVGAPTDADIDAALDFVRLLRDLRTAPDAGTLPLAAEACLSLAEIVTQIERRHRRLAVVATTQPDLRACLEDDFAPLFATARARAEALYHDGGLDPSADLEPGRRTLSPSDFGFHNALQRPDGGLAFLDFEYFGWDDPVRLATDLPWHPGMTLTEGQRRRFVAGIGVLFSADPGYPVRLAALWPLVGLRWSMILLNEYLPERWAGRVHAGQSLERQAVLARQLSKARNFLKKAKRSMHFPDVSSSILGGDHAGE